MWGHPGKKLLFMGQEFAQPEEWNHEIGLPWHLLDHAPHQGVRNLVRDLNALYRTRPALHRWDSDARGFEWLVLNDSDNSVYAFLRKDQDANYVIVVCNFTPVVRPDYRLPIPSEHAHWQEILNTDAECYGGSNVGNGAHWLKAEANAAHGRAHSLRLTIPPLATLMLAPVPA
jgi:1,4-alpha-glucan branching enzyme